jgi:hypothetical protein
MGRSKLEGEDGSDRPIGRGGESWMSLYDTGTNTIASGM